MAVVAAPPAARVDAVRAWWRAARPGPSAGQRLEALYIVAITAAIFGVLVYGTAKSALAQVVTPHTLEVLGPGVVLLALLLLAQWGAYHGPVVFSVADVAHLLGAPLPRRGLAVGRLARALAAGAGAGALLAAVTAVGLAGDGRGIAPAAVAGLVVGGAEAGTLGIAAAWAVERSARWERALARLAWPAVLVAAALAAVATLGPAGREVALWSGPWGWAVQAGAAERDAERLAALLLLTVVTLAAVRGALRRAGDCPTERHLRRAEASASALASLMSLDARTARRAVEAVGERGTGGGAAELPRVRAFLARRGDRRSARVLAVAWRDAVSALRAPGVFAQAAALVAAGSALDLLAADRPLAVALGALAVYAGAARMLGPLRRELDVPDRAPVLLRPGIGAVLLAHALLPAAVTASVAALAAVGCALAGALPAPGAGVALAAVAVGPLLAGCAGAAARREGRMSPSVFVTAMAADPSGGAAAVLGWLALWPAVAATLGSAPILLLAHGGTSATLPAAVVILGGAAVVVGILARPVERP
jgi:hypothetical protein